MNSAAVGIHLMWPDVTCLQLRRATSVSIYCWVNMEVSVSYTQTVQVSSFLLIVTAAIICLLPTTPYQRIIYTRSMVTQGYQRLFNMTIYLLFLYTTIHQWLKWAGVIKNMSVNRPGWNKTWHLGYNKCYQQNITPIDIKGQLEKYK